MSKEGASQTAASGEFFVLSHSPAAMAGRVPVELRIPAGAVAPGTRIVLTSLSAQALPGLLPLGWSPLAAATVTSGVASIPAATITFTVPSADVAASGQILTAAQYHGAAHQCPQQFHPEAEAPSFLRSSLNVFRVTVERKRRLGRRELSEGRAPVRNQSCLRGRSFEC